MPPYTLYCKYEPECVGKPEIKYDTIGNNDWVRQDLSSIDASDSGELSDRLTEMQTKGVSYPLELDCAGRDGFFDDDQLFMVYEKVDIKRLIAELQQCLKGTI